MQALDSHAPLPVPEALRASGELAFLDGGGVAARMIRERDWSGHPLGEPGTWPEGLKVALSLALNSPESIILAWGPGLYFFFNDTYFPLLGPRLSWAMGARFDEVWADGWEQARPIIEEAFSGRSTRFVDLPWKLDTDRGLSDTWWTFSYSRILDGSGLTVGLFILTNETTSRVLGDAALKESQVRLETALDEVSGLAATLERRVDERTAERDRIWKVSRDLLGVATPDGVIVSVNPAWKALLGWDPHEIAGRTTEWMEHPDDRARSRHEVARVADGTNATSFENRLRARDGSWAHVSWTAVIADGMIYCVGRDVTAEKAHAEALARTEEALRQAQKMEAVGQLTGGLAHDFNNLLAGISGALELMQTRIGQGRMSDIDRYMAAAQGASKRAAALTHRLLAFSRRQTLDPKPTDANRLVAGMEELVSRTVGPAVAIEVVGAAGLWLALVDPPQLENALLNLCINARDAMPDGGRIVIETANRWFDDRAAREHDLASGQYLALSVTDTGSGMEPDVVAKAFDPFFTTKPIGQGTGLGLSMIHGFVRQSGGQVRIDSEIGRGTTVTLFLPRHLGASDTGEALPELMAAPRAERGETVLVVDDEPTVRMLVTEVLEDLGYTAIEAADGPAGLKVLQSDIRIDLLVTDVGLPGGMNGRQVADAARVRRPELGVLFITGYAENAAVGNGHLEPGMQVLTKPFAMDALAARIREMIAERRHHVGSAVP